jgi:hypothetical protein
MYISETNLSRILVDYKIFVKLKLMGQGNHYITAYIADFPPSRVFLFVSSCFLWI